MKLAALVLVTWMDAALGADTRSKGSMPVTVHLQVNAEIPYRTRTKALAITTGMYKQIGVQIRWAGDTKPRTSEAAALWLEITDRSPATSVPGTMAYALPYEGTHVLIFWDRIQPTLSPHTLLAHVLAHEIGHMLQGINRHSETGVMKARFTPRDLNAMLDNPLEFEPQDVRLIQHGLASRIASVAPSPLGRKP